MTVDPPESGPQDSAAFPRTAVLDTPVSVATLSTMADRLFHLVEQGTAGYVCVVNVHMVVEARRDPELMAAVRGAVEATTDGVPLVWEVRRQGFTAAERVYGPSLTLELCARMERAGQAVAFYGGTEETLDALDGALAKRFPNLRIAALISPPLLPAKPPFDPEAARQLEEAGAPLVFIGLGCPKQEIFMARHTDHVPALMIGVGAAFDFIAGVKRSAPAWMKRAGLEWLFRLASEPRRLWRRYLVTNTLFAWAWLRARFRSLFAGSG